MHPKIYNLFGFIIFLNIVHKYKQEEEVQGRRSRNPSFSKSINPQSIPDRRGGRRSRTASEGDSWTVTSSSSPQLPGKAHGVQLYSGRHSSGGLGSSTTTNVSSKGNTGIARVQQHHKVYSTALYNICPNPTFSREYAI